jgi:glutaconate CoA-transferase subunit A
MQVIEAGMGELFKLPDLDEHRVYIRQHKSRELKNKVLTEQEAVKNLVRDGDYLCYDCTMVMRGPSSLIREIIRQKKRNLSVGGRFTYFIISLLAAGDCLSNIDVGFIGIGNALSQALDTGKIKVTEWSNSALTMRLMAGAMGIPFMPVRFLGGTDAFHYSAAKLVESPFDGTKVTLVPALNPDVGLIHVHQCDIYGNARIFGPSVSPKEIAASSKKVIISTEEIIDHEYIRRDPGKTTIPYYLVDAVVEASFGAHPGEVQGLYSSDSEHIMELVRAAQSMPALKNYLGKCVFTVKDHQEYLQKIVGLARMQSLKQRAKIKEGYYL